MDPIPPRPEPDTVAWALAKLDKGETGAAIRELYDRFGDRLKRQISVQLDRRLAGRIDPEDVLQEAFVDITARLRKFEPERNVPLFHWLRMIVRERIIATHRRHLVTAKRDARREAGPKNTQESDDSAMSLAEMILGNDTSVGGRYLRTERHAKLAGALEEIAPPDREIILMRVYEGLSNEEAATALGIQPDAAKKRITRAIRRLGELLRTLPEFAIESGMFGD